MCYPWDAGHRSEIRARWPWESAFQCYEKPSLPVWQNSISEFQAPRVLFEVRLLPWFSLWLVKICLRGFTPRFTAGVGWFTQRAQSWRLGTRSTGEAGSYLTDNRGHPLDSSPTPLLSLHAAPSLADWPSYNKTKAKPWNNAPLLNSSAWCCRPVTHTKRLPGACASQINTSHTCASRRNSRWDPLPFRSRVGDRGGAAAAHSTLPRSLLSSVGTSVHLCIPTSLCAVTGPFHVPEILQIHPGNPRKFLHWVDSGKQSRRKAGVAPTGGCIRKFVAS